MKKINKEERAEELEKVYKQTEDDCTVLDAVISMLSCCESTLNYGKLKEDRQSVANSLWRVEEELRELLHRFENNCQLLYDLAKAADNLKKTETKNTYEEGTV